MNQRGIAFWLIPLVLLAGYFLLVLTGIGLSILFKSIIFVLVGGLIVYAAWFIQPSPFKKNAGMLGLLGLAVAVFGIFGQGWLFTSTGSTASGSAWHGNSAGLNEMVTSQPMSVVSCTAPAPYDVCYGWDETYGDATAQARIFTYQLVQGTRSGSYFIGPSTWGGDTNPGSKLYYTDSCYSTWDKFWAAAGCSDMGCTGLVKVNTPFSVTLSTIGNPYTGCPTLVAVNRTQTSTYWAWAMTAYGWNGGNMLSNITSIASPTPTPNPTPTPGPTTNPTPTPTPIMPGTGGMDYTTMAVIVGVVVLLGGLLFMPKKWLKKMVGR